MSAKVRLYEGPASRHEGDGEIIREFSTGPAGGLIAFRRLQDGDTIKIDVYRTDGRVVVHVDDNVAKHTAEAVAAHNEAKTPAQIVEAYGKHIVSFGHDPLELVARLKTENLAFSNLPMYSMAAEVEAQIALLARLDQAGVIRPAGGK